MTSPSRGEAHHPAPDPDGSSTLPRSRIQSALLAWYRTSARSLPWRETNDPYAIWVSEIMLQQTRVATVIPYYEQFLEALPTIADLAAADADLLRRLWRGLGYYRRVSLLQRGAREVVEHHGGRLPGQYEQLRKLSGLGPYTAGAVASIAFGQPVSAVDGNVIRVFSRWTNDDRPVEAIRKSLQSGWADAWVPLSDPGSWNQALMELGATLCTPRSPRCGECPVQRWCGAWAAGTVDTLPVKARKVANIPARVRALVYRRDDRVWLEKRPEEGLLAGLWGFPLEDADADTPGHAVLRYRHVFTHRTWHVAVHVVDGEPPAGSGRWTSVDNLAEEAIPTAFRPIVTWLTTRDLFSG